MRVSGRYGAPYGYAVEPESVPLFRCVTLDDGRPAVQLWPGLLEPALAAMEAQGLSVEVTVSDPPPLAVTRSCGGTYPGLLGFIAEHERGLIRPDTSSGVDVIALIAHIASSCRGARIAIIVPDAGLIWLRALRRSGCDVELSTYRSSYLGGSRIVVATPGALGTVGIERADIVIVTSPLARMRDDPLLAEYPVLPPSPDSHYQVNLMERLADVRGRLFAILSRHHRLSRYEAARLAQVYGLAEYIAAGNARTERRVRVAWERLVGGPTPIAGSTAMEAKRTAVWSHPVLARRAATLALTLAQGNRKVLQQRWPNVAPGLSRAGAQRVLILVEGPEHADTIAARLPGWRVVTAETQVETDLDRSPITGVIATALGADRLHSDQVDVVIRLDLGSGSPPLPLPRWLDTSNYQQGPLLVIDYDTRSHPLLRKWSIARRAAYRAAGWGEVGQAPETAALERYLARTSCRRART